MKTFTKRPSHEEKKMEMVNDRDLLSYAVMSLVLSNIWLWLALCQLSPLMNFLYHLQTEFRMTKRERVKLWLIWEALRLSLRYPGSI